jgi:hypothetical protein
MQAKNAVTALLEQFRQIAISTEKTVSQHNVSGV